MKLTRRNRGVRVSVLATERYELLRPRLERELGREVSFAEFVDLSAATADWMVLVEHARTVELARSMTET